MSVVQTALSVAGYLLVLLGTFFCLAMTVGILRFPDALTRLHASTKGLTIGAGFILVGAGILSGSAAFAARTIVIAAFMFLTNPIAAHAIARASYRSEVAHPEMELDEYSEYLGRQGIMTDDDH